MPGSDPTLSRIGLAGVVLAALHLMAIPALAQDSSVPSRLLMFGTSAVATVSMDSMVQVALQTRDFARQSTTINRLQQYGRVWAYQKEPRPVIVYTGVVARLREVFPGAHPVVRSGIVRGLPLQAEQADALAWLKELMKSPEIGANDIRIAEGAVEALARMGPAGEDELRRFHLSGEADEGIQDMLDRLAQTGYRRPPGGR